MSTNIAQAIADTRTAFQADRSLGQVTYKSQSKLGDGFCSNVQLGEHHLTIDEPEAIGGTDTGPSPVEIILAALGTCQEITYRAYADALGISLNGVSVTVEGDIDLAGFFGIDENTRPGYGAIRAAVTLDSDASEAELEKLKAIVDAHCPVLDILRNPSSVETTLVK